MSLQPYNVPFPLMAGHRFRGSYRVGALSLFILALPACSGDGGSGSGSPGPSGGVPGSGSSAGAASGGNTSAAGGSGPGGSSAAGSGGAGPATGGGGAGAGSGGVGSGGVVPGGGSAGEGSGGSGINPEPSQGVTGAPIGFATLNGGTSGGAGGETVFVATYADLKTYAESPTPYTIIVQGTISNGPNGGRIAVQSNKSIVGVGGTAFLDGVGLAINGANNVIVQNLRISLTGVTTRTDTADVYTTADGGRILVNDGDAISISGTSKNVWIDHCELFSEDPSTQTNKDLYDGLIDIKGQTGFITISSCYLHDHHKGGLVGASDDDVFADRKVTFHHNHYENVKLRVPMYRGSVGHFFNNYVFGATDATEIRASTCVRVERNYYDPLHYSIYTPADSPGSTERIDNIEVERTTRAYPASCTADIPYPYSDVLISTTQDVKTLVPQGAGVGRF